MILKMLRTQLESDLEARDHYRRQLADLEKKIAEHEHVIKVLSREGFDD